MIIVINMILSGYSTCIYNIISDNNNGHHYDLCRLFCLYLEYYIICDNNNGLHYDFCRLFYLYL